MTSKLQVIASKAIDYLRMIIAPVGNLGLQIRRGIFWPLYSAGGGQAPAFSIGSRIKVEDRKLLMIFFGGFIIRFCGFDFIVEVSNGSAFAVIAYLDIPFLCGFVPYYTLGTSKETPFS